MTAFGAVYRDLTGALQAHGPHPNPAFATWFNALPPGTQVLSLVRAPGAHNHTIIDVLNDIQVVQQAHDDPHFFAAAAPVPHVNDTYVYLYFTGCNPHWGNVFYIGKGTRVVQGTPRHDQHIEGTLDKNAYGLPLTRKETMILNEMPRVQAANGGPLITDYSGYRTARPALIAAGNELNRIAFVFNHGDTTARAFCTEYHLISSLYGAFSVSNDTSGNSLSRGLRIISRPKAFNASHPRHAAWWSMACNEFINTPNGVSAASKALLRVMALETLVPQFENDWIAPGTPLHGLIAPDTGITLHNPHKSPLLHHVCVANGQDATVNYKVIARPGGQQGDQAGGNARVPNPPFRLELKDNKTSPAVRINLRPCKTTKQALQAFRNHIKHKVGHFYTTNPISIPNGRGSFFKPFAPAANGDFDTDFELLPTTGAYSRTIGGLPGYCWPDWHPNRHARPHVELNIGEAIEAVLTYLL
jgi:hypothetical protein